MCVYLLRVTRVTAGGNDLLWWKSKLELHQLYQTYCVSPHWHTYRCTRTHQYTHTHTSTHRCSLALSANWNTFSALLNTIISIRMPVKKVKQRRQQIDIQLFSLGLPESATEERPKEGSSDVGSESAANVKQGQRRQRYQQRTLCRHLIVFYSFKKNINIFVFKACYKKNWNVWICLLS